MVGYTLARAMGPGTRLCSDLFEVRACIPQLTNSSGCCIGVSVYLVCL